DCGRRARRGRSSTPSASTTTVITRRHPSDRQRSERRKHQKRSSNVPKTDHLVPPDELSQIYGSRDANGLAKSARRKTTSLASTARSAPATEPNPRSGRATVASRPRQTTELSPRVASRRRREQRPGLSYRLTGPGGQARQRPPDFSARECAAELAYRRVL